MSVIRAARVRLLGLADDKLGRAKVAIVRLVVDDGPLPRVLMHDGDPFVLESLQGSEGLPLYARERAVRIDPGMIEEVAAMPSGIVGIAPGASASSSPSGASPPEKGWKP